MIPEYIKLIYRQKLLYSKNAHIRWRYVDDIAIAYVIDNPNPNCTEISIIGVLNKQEKEKYNNLKRYFKNDTKIFTTGIHRGTKMG